MCELPKNCADCDCGCDELQVWGEIDLRLEALKLAVNQASLDASSKVVVAAAVDFYNFLNGDMLIEDDR
jgi:hypothetical protein